MRSSGPRNERALTTLAAVEDVIYAVIALFLVVSGALLLVGAGRDSLILTANSETVRSGADFTVYWVQLLLLIVLVVAMVASLFIWRRSHPATDDS